MKNFAQPAAVLAMSVVGAGFLVHSSPADAFNFGVSGQIDRALTAATNGDDQDIGFVGNVGSDSRFRFTGDQKLDNGMKVGFIYEIAIYANPSSTFDVNNGGGDNSTDNVDMRLANGYIEGNFGKLTFGRLNGAGNGTSEVDYSGTGGLGGGIDIEDYAGGISFIDDSGHRITNLGGAFDEMDAISRQNGIRYDTPSFGGLVVSASLDDGHAYEIAPRYELTMQNGLKFGAAADFVDTEDQGFDRRPNGIIVTPGNRFQEYGGSASVLFPFGLVLSGAYKYRDFINDSADAQNYNNYFGGIGYVAGKNHLEATFDQTNDKLNEGSKFRGYGLAYVYDWTNAIQTYASYHHYTLNDALQQNADSEFNGQKVSGQNIDQIYMGFRLKFL